MTENYANTYKNSDHVWQKSNKNCLRWSVDNIVKPHYANNL